MEIKEREDIEGQLQLVLLSESRPTPEVAVVDVAALSVVWLCNDASGCWIFSVKLCFDLGM